MSSGFLDVSQIDVRTTPALLLTTSKFQFDRLTSLLHRLYIYGGLDIREGIISKMNYLYLSFLKGGEGARQAAHVKEAAGTIGSWIPIND